MMDYGSFLFYFADQYELVKPQLQLTLTTAACLMSIYAAWTLYKIKRPGLSLMESFELKAIEDEPCDLTSEPVVDKMNKFPRTQFYYQKNYIIKDTEPEFINMIQAHKQNYNRGAKSVEEEDEEYLVEEEKEDESEEIGGADTDEGELEYAQVQRRCDSTEYDENKAENELYFEEDTDENEEDMNEEEDYDQINEFKSVNSQEYQEKADDNEMEGDENCFSSGSSDMWSDDGCKTVFHVSDIEHETEPNIHSDNTYS